MRLEVKHMVMKRKLKVSDIERLENTSPASGLIGNVDGIGAGTWTCPDTTTCCETSPQSCTCPQSMTCPASYTCPTSGTCDCGSASCCCAATACITGPPQETVKSLIANINVDRE